MSKLLDLASQLVANAVRSNLYTDTSSFDIAPKSPLSFQERRPHVQHASATSRIIPSSLNTPPAPHGMHDTRGDFINTNNGKVKESKRREIYSPNKPTPSIRDQEDSLKATGKLSSPNLGSYVPGGNSQIRNLDRDEIYETKPGSSTASKSPLADLLDFHEQKSHEKHGEAPRVIPSPQTPAREGSRFSVVGSVNKSGLSPSQHGQLPRDLIYGYGVDIPSVPSDLNHPIQGETNTPIFSNAHRLGNSYSEENKFSTFNSPVPSVLRSFDVFAIANWLRGVLRETGVLPIQNNDPITGQAKVERTGKTISKGLTWLASQFYLTSLNPDSPHFGGEFNKIWNPLSVPVSAIPLTRPDLGVGVTAQALLSSVGLAGLDTSQTQVEKQSVFIPTQEALARVVSPLEPERVKLQNTSLLAQLAQTANQFNPFSSPIDDRKFTGNKIPFSATPGETNVRFLGQSDYETEGVMYGALSEDETYIPFMFQDLRDSPAKFMYFRAFLKDGLSENFTPEWQIQKYYGRVEGIPTYSHTTRTVSLGFDVVAFSPADLPIMWKKLHKLQSMVYPAFSQKGYLQSAPIIRMRVGDLISSTNNRGLPGYINSINFAYDDGIWTVEENFKIPRKVSVTLSFTTLHDNNIGVLLDDDGFFGGISLIESEDFNTFASTPTDVRGVMQSVDDYYRNYLGEGLI